MEVLQSGEKIEMKVFEGVLHECRNSSYAVLSKWKSLMIRDVKQLLVRILGRNM